jgi:hypothetical protein
MSTERRYLSYLLRVWLVEENGERVWRASLEVTHSGEKHGFASLENLFAFLKEQTHCNDISNMVPPRSLES